MQILGIDTSGKVAAAALYDTEQHCIKAQQTLYTRRTHSQVILPLAERILSDLEMTWQQVEGFAVAVGPGSYTGLRIGTSMAKGVCYGRGVSLVAIPTLELMCVPVLLQEMVEEENALLCPMIDARRMEVYAQLFDRSLHEVRPIQADVVDADTYREYLDERPVYFFGNGAAKCMDVIAHPNAHYIDGIEPLAKNMFPLAERRIAQGQTEDVAYFVPFYLKDFVAKMPKKLL